ncbi:hypothetical protein N2601_32230 (plasmid) [Rhizobium sp. CB3060]|uniref:hypothetical protein n=1 Tax=Rhizobium sp. CB3060 TaxID=3138255 RepID=UPI0021A4C544|nr:hypothetical protein [Rhizobium tropici]UWU25998.1 hypothetical protein N2601_32230 [Rhizobium tropici]
MKQPKRPFIVEIKPSRSKGRQKDRGSIWGKLDIAGTARAIAEQGADGCASDEAVPDAKITRFERNKS